MSESQFGQTGFYMECPSEPFLKLFVDNPDAALEESPEFEDHLECCKECQGKLERLANTPHGGDPFDVVHRQHSLAAQIPEIAGYRLLEEVGAGSFGVVHRALHLESDRPVAVKIIRRLDPSDWKRIELEREVLVQCDHAHVITLLDCGQCSGGFYFVYRWMEQSLGQYIAKETVVDLKRATTWIIQLSSGVSYIHALGIVHRDLKPSNILLSKIGIPKLIDFGIAKNVTLDDASTINTRPVGTPGFMAPEQTGLTQDRVSFATDVYGLGAVLYALITAAALHRRGNDSDVLARVVAARA